MLARRRVERGAEAEDVAMPDEEASSAAPSKPHAEEMVEGEIRAWAHWGSPEPRMIASLPTRLAPAIDPAVGGEGARGEMKCEILRLYGTAEDAAGAYLEFAPDKG